ncbi:hypothetical protein GCM10009769_31080 [Curtobacterium luteum]|uniref:Uncharacterized protein n=1 Tax=Curtobacterium luteum TaxID=33881 RepID=A0A8H9L1H2_9MICO|nr:hypothetical protein GCM10009769_31080 [Curtobacterium luteum]
MGEQPRCEVTERSEPFEDRGLPVDGVVTAGERPDDHGPVVVVRERRPRVLTAGQRPDEPQRSAEEDAPGVDGPVVHQWSVLSVFVTER